MTKSKMANRYPPEARARGLSIATFYKLKRLLADTMLDNVVLKDLLGKN